MSSSSPHPASGVEKAQPFRRVLAASFLDESGARAALRAARLPLAPGARVALLHVVAPWSMHSARVSTREAARALEGLVAAGKDAALAAGNQDTDLVPMVAEGWPAPEIVRTAWQERCELIVVGPPGARIDGSTRATLFRVMRSADLPLLVARSDPFRDHRRVLCAIERSITAVDTIALAARLGGAKACDLTLFHAFQVPFQRWMGSEPPEVGEDAAAYVRAFARAVAGDVGITRTLIRRGEFCVELLRAAADERADLVVLGTHGRSGISRAIRGSAAEWVIANTPFDVAVARPHRMTLERRLP